MKHFSERPFADPQAAARKLIELAASIEPVQDGRIHIEEIDYSFLYMLKGSGPEFGAGVRCAVQKGWLELHEIGTYVRLLTPGEDLLARPEESSIVARLAVSPALSFVLAERRRPNLASPVQAGVASFGLLGI